MTLDEGGAGLHEIVDDDDVTTDGFALFEFDDAFGALAHFGADDALVSGEEGVETLVRPLVGIGDDDVVGVLERVQTLDQQRNTALKAR